MAGDGSKKSQPKELKQTKSTPTQNQRGVDVPLELVKLAKYGVNIRSFHPNIKFERGGFRFHGDDRGFSLGDSFHPVYGDKTPANPVTSRIWQRFTLDLDSKQTTNLQTAANESSGPWPISDGPEPYTDKRYHPAGKVAGAIQNPHGGQATADLSGSYRGKNFAFLGSRLDQRTLGTTVVPDLDVAYEIWLRIERINKYMDVGILAYGDGFPNCEAFIKDNAGNKLFLGTHVRIGTPLTHLMGDNKRIMFGSAVRIGLDTNGNFQDRLWIFAQLLRAQARNKPIKHFKLVASHQTVIEDIDIATARKNIASAWEKPPADKNSSLSAWNNYHLHRNPNEARDRDSYDLDPSKWRK